MNLQEIMKFAKFTALKKRRPTVPADCSINSIISIFPFSYLNPTVVRVAVGEFAIDAVSCITSGGGRRILNKTA